MWHSAFQTASVGLAVCGLTLLSTGCTAGGGDEGNSDRGAAEPTEGVGGTTTSSSGSNGDGGGAGGGGGQPVSGGGAGGGADGGGEPLDCSSYPYSPAALLDERVGFGAGATGGNPSNVYHVTTLAGAGSGSLAEALASTDDYWIVFDVEGTITLAGGKAHIESNKTIDGRGRDITIEGNLIVDGEQNIILADVALTNDLEGHCTQAGDVVTLKGNGTSPASYETKHIWLHHVELYNGGDGLFDLRGASLVTLSWSHLHTHKKGILASSNQDDSDATGMRVTFHHNFFDRITLRGPQFKYGWAHYFNNYQFEWYEYGAASLAGAQFASEGNIFEARPGDFCLQACPDPNPCGDNDFFVSKKALVDDWSGNGQGYVRSAGDLLLNGAVVTEHQPGTVFEPANEYGYVAEPATEALAAQIAAEAGPRTTYCQ